MKKAGAIIALIAGIFGVLAAISTLFIGGMGAAFEAEGFDTVVGLGWGGIAFSFLVIILAALSFGAKRRIVGILLIIFSIAGAVLGGTLVAICMLLSLVGGVLVVMGSNGVSGLNNSQES